MRWARATSSLDLQCYPLLSTSSTTVTVLLCSALSSVSNPGAGRRRNNIGNKPFLAFSVGLID